MLGPNAVLKQLEAVDEDRKEESVEDEFEDCRVDLEDYADEDESEGGRCEHMNRDGLVAFVKDNDDDNDEQQGETDEDDPNYTPPVEKSDTEDDSSEEDDEGNESDIDDDDQEQNVAEMRPHKKGIEATSEDESEDDEEKNKVKRSIFGKKRGLPLGQASESESKKRKSSFDTDDNMEEDEDNREVDELTETQKSILEAAEEGLYDNLDEEDPEEGFKTGRGQDPRISKGNMAEDDSSYQSDADEEGGEVCTI